MNEYLQKVFTKDLASGRFIVEVLLEKYIYAFNEWDSSYFRRRDLDPDLIHFLESCSNEIPIGYDLDLLFTVSQTQDEALEHLLAASVRNNFAYSLVLQRRNLTTLHWRIVRYVGLAFLFLLLATGLEPVVPEIVVGRTLTEGLFIGGWVFLWEAISLFSFNRFDITRRMQEYKRLSRAKIRFTYGNTPMKERMKEKGDYPEGAGARKKDAIKGEANP